MRYLLFGTLQACVNFAKDHDFHHGQWIHASERDKVVGLPTSSHEAVIVGPTLDEGAVSALREWQFRRGMHALSKSR